MPGGEQINRLISGRDPFPAFTSDGDGRLLERPGVITRLPFGGSCNRCAPRIFATVAAGAAGDASFEYVNRAEIWFLVVFWDRWKCRDMRNGCRNLQVGLRLAFEPAGGAVVFVLWVLNEGVNKAAHPDFLKVYVFVVIVSPSFDI